MRGRFPQPPAHMLNVLDVMRVYTPCMLLWWRVWVRLCEWGACAGMSHLPEAVAGDIHHGVVVGA